MARKKLPDEVEIQVIVNSRRRCCMCYALERDTGIKQGQIAHIDRNSANDDLSNLAFLCLQHHDSYDSKTSQSKGFRPKEIKRYQEELIEWIGSALSQKVHFGVLSLPPDDPYAGQWLRIGSNESPAELQVIPLPDTFDGQARYFVMGMAYHGMSKEFGPNMGGLDFVSEIIDGNRLNYTRRSLVIAGPASTELVFTDDGYLKIYEEDTAGQYGAGVTFDGMYRRAN